METIGNEGTAVTVATAMDAVSRAELTRALARLQNGGGLVMRLADMVGGVVGRTVRMGTQALGVMPGGSAAMQGVVEAALRRAFDIAVLRLHDGGEQARSRRLATPLVMLSGAVGGFVGLGRLRAGRRGDRRSPLCGRSRASPRTRASRWTKPARRAACLEVFALTVGGSPGSDSELGYFGARMALQGRPLALLLSEVAGRFGLTLSQKIAVQAVPVVGRPRRRAAVNAAFLSHYRELARAHFTVRRMERVFGAQTVRARRAAAP